MGKLNFAAYSRIFCLYKLTVGAFSQSFARARSSGLVGLLFYIICFVIMIKLLDDI